MSTEDATEVAGKYLTFRLADEDYGLQILKVQEIIGMMSVTRVPKTPDFIRGVINLRGKVIPVVELRSKFSLGEAEDTEVTCIIVVQVQVGDQTIVMGIIVDEVSEVMDIAAEQVEPAPAFGAAVDTQFILGMGKLENRVVMLLDIDHVLNTEDMAVVTKVTA
jgi:purine-binding chemotaxis protein CheW